MPLRQLPLKMEFRSLSQKESLIATVAYADIFAYPLAREELRQWNLFYPVSRFALPKKIEEYGGCIVLAGRRHIIAKRLAQNVWQEDKWRIARRASRWLSFVPTIQLVGVTGGLAMNNADRDDDIDLFCIVAGNTLWISRFLATLLMDILGLRRHPADKRVVNKVCLNMFMAEDGLGVTPAEQDCFSAHEVLQMQPVWQTEGIYKKFLHANAWVRTFLPNAWKERNAKWSMPNAKVKDSNYLFSIYHVAFIILEPLARVLQLWYMRGHRTNEVITDVVLRFHPKDARVWIKHKLGVRLAKYNIPLDKVFWAN